MQHVSSARRGVRRRWPVAIWICKVEARGGAVEVVPLELDAERDTAEIAWIARLRAGGADLLNVTDGGNDGSPTLGSTNGSAKLSEALVSEILASTERSDTLAKRLGVSKATISRVRSGSGWKHVEGNRHRDGRKNLRRFFVGSEPTDEGRELSRRYEAGESRDALAVAFGTTTVTITRTLEAMGVSRRDGGAPRRPLMINGKTYPGVLAAMSGEGMSHARLMREARFI